MNEPKEKFSRISITMCCPFVVKNNRIFYMSHFFFLLLWNSEFLYKSAVVTLPIHYDRFWYAVHLLSSDVFFDKCGFLRTQYCGHKRIKIIFYWIADGVYWSAVLFTNPPVTITIPGCCLPIRGVINQSAVSFTSPRLSITEPRKKK